MEMKRVTLQMFAHNQQQNDGKAKNDNLKGIKLPKSESLEHMLYNLKLNSKISPDMYDVDCRAVAKNIQGITPRQLTCGGCGG